MSSMLKVKPKNSPICRNVGSLQVGSLNWLQKIAGSTPEYPTLRILPVEQKIFDFVKGACELVSPPVVARVAGGWVRDKLLGVESKDIDISVDRMTGQEFSRLLVQFEKQRIYAGEEAALKSTDFKSVGIKEGKDPSERLEDDDIGQQDPQVAFLSIYGQEVEILNLRAGEEYEEGKHMLVQFQFGSPEQDAYRRDLTINSLFYNINTGQLEDFTGHGLSDLLGQQIVLRVPINVSDPSMNPVKTFMDDPLRVLRVIRFLSRYENAVIEPETYEAMQNDRVMAHLYRRVHNHAEQRGISPERVAIEFRKMLEGARPEEAVRIMWQLGLLQGLFNLPKEFDKDLNMDQRSPYHELGVLEHTLLVMKHANNLAMEFGMDKRERSLVNMAALWHDIGKLDPKTHIISEKGGRIQVGYYGKKEKRLVNGVPTEVVVNPAHEASSVEQWKRFAKSLKLTNYEADVVADYIGGHMEPHRTLQKRHIRGVKPGGGLKERAREDLNLHMQENPRWKIHWLLAAADALGKNAETDQEDVPYRNMIDVMSNLMNERPADQQEKLTAPLNGHDLMRIMKELELEFSPKPPKQSGLARGYIWILQRWLIEEAASRDPNVNPLTVAEAEQLVRSPEWIAALQQLYSGQYPNAEYDEGGQIRLPQRPNAVSNIEGTPEMEGEQI